MREILFIAKRKDNGEWVEGYYRRIPCMGMLEHYIMPRNPKNRMEQYAIDPDTLCQYTGLTDKNGISICSISPLDKSCRYGRSISRRNG